MIVLHLMDKLLDMNMKKLRMDTQSCSQLDRISLPCSKAMWEAPTKDAWELEYKKYLSNRKGVAMIEYGDLRRMNDRDVSESPGEVVKDLMDELRDTSDKVMYARRLLIDLTADYNVKLVTFPSNLIAGMFHFEALKGLQTPNDGDSLSVSEDEMKTPKVNL